jgi:hypothetical protein
MGRLVGRVGMWSIVVFSWPATWGRRVRGDEVVVQVWWWVVPAVMVVALLAVVLVRSRGQGRDEQAPPGRSAASAGVAAAAAGGAAGAVGAAGAAAAVVQSKTAAEPAAPKTAASDPATDGRERNGVAAGAAGSTGDPAGAGSEADSESGADPPIRRIPEPADSALAALDFGLVGQATMFGAAAAVAAAVIRPGPHAGSALPAADGSAPADDYTIKANDGSHRYYTPDSPYYFRTRGDLWFRTAGEAAQAGFTAWNSGRLG